MEHLCREILFIVEIIRKSRVEEDVTLLGTLKQSELGIERGDIFLAEYFFDGTMRTKPVVVVQNDIGNRYSPVVIVVPVVPHDGKSSGDLMTVVLEDGYMDSTNLRESCVMVNVILTLEKSSFQEKIGSLPAELMAKVEKGLLVSLGFKNIGR